MSGLLALPRRQVSRVTPFVFDWDSRNGLVSEGAAGTFTRAGLSGHLPDYNGKLIGRRMQGIQAYEQWDHDADGARERRGLRMEPIRTNQLVRSAEYENAAWTKTDVSVTQNIAPLSPHGDLTADQITEGSAGTALLSQAATFSSGAVVAFSDWLYRGNHDWVVLTVFNGGASYHGYFNLATQTAGSVVSAGAGTAIRGYVAETLGPWTRCCVVGSLTGITSYNCATLSATADGNSTRVAGALRYQGDAQAEVGRWASSTLPTAGATVSRAARDDYRFPLLWNCQPFALGIDFTEVGGVFGAAAETLVFMGLGTDGAIDPRVGINNNSSGVYRAVWDPGTQTTASLAAAPSFGQRTRLVLIVPSAAGVPTIYQKLGSAAYSSATGSAQPFPTPGPWGASQANARIVFCDAGASGSAPCAASIHRVRVSIDPAILALTGESLISRMLP